MSLCFSLIDIIISASSSVKCAKRVLITLHILGFDFTLNLCNLSIIFLKLLFKSSSLDNSWNFTLSCPFILDKKLKISLLVLVSDLLAIFSNDYNAFIILFVLSECFFPSLSILVSSNIFIMSLFIKKKGSKTNPTPSQHKQNLLLFSHFNRSCQPINF